MSLIWVNYPAETYTPTSSGALATIIWECSKQAVSEGIVPSVITRPSPFAPFAVPEICFVPYPRLPSSRLLKRALGAHRRITGWEHLRHRAYAIRVAAAISALNRPADPLVLFNDPAMAVFLRGRFPERRIVHWFENQHGAPSKRVRDRFASSVDVTLGVSDFTSKWISSHYSVPDVKTLYNGVDIELFSPANETNEGPPIIGFVGRTGIEKAPDLLLKAAIKLSARDRNFALQLVGSNHWDRFEFDEYQRELRELTATLDAAGVKTFHTGHVGRAELPEVLRRTQIHVVPSRWDEPFGLTTVEGMATGLAIIASATGGTPEVIGEAGLLFAKDDVGELAEHLYTLLHEPETRKRYMIAARERAKQFTWRRTWQELKVHAGI